MDKCEKCQKSITKRSPDLECSRCEKIVHMNTSCSGLTNKQLTALRATDNLEWACHECHESSPKRRSVIIPNDDDDEETQVSIPPNAQINVKQLLKDISKEVEKSIQREMREINQALQFNSEKMEDLIECVEACKQSIQDLKKKNTELNNKNNFLETRVGALEQRIQEMEQNQLSNQVEISNIPCMEEENLPKIIEKVAEKLQLPTKDIVRVTRLAGKKDRPSPIHVELNDESTQQKWITTAKKTKVSLEDIISPPKSITEAPSPTDIIFIREALTSYNKRLLWNAKQELQNIYKFIWCKKGVIMVRKQENDKVIRVRSLEDIKKLTQS